MRRWVKIWKSGYEYLRLFDKSGKLLGEVEELRGADDARLVDATDCRSRPYKDLGQYRSVRDAKVALLKALDSKEESHA